MPKIFLFFNLIACLSVCLEIGFLFLMIINSFFSFVKYVILIFIQFFTSILFQYDTVELCDFLLFTVIFLNYGSLFIFCFLKILFKIKINIIRVKWQKQSNEEISNIFILLWLSTGHLLTQMKSQYLQQKWLQVPTK